MIHNFADRTMPLIYIFCVVAGLVAALANPVARLSAEETALFALAAALVSFGFFWTGFLLFRLYSLRIQKYALLFIVFFFIAGAFINLLLGLHDIGVGISDSERPLLIALVPAGVAVSAAAYVHYRRLHLGA